MQSPRDINKKTKINARFCFSCEIRKYLRSSRLVNTIFSKQIGLKLNLWVFNINYTPIVPKKANLISTPRNIIHARPRLLQIAANDPLKECCEVLTQFGFRRKMLYLCTSEEERALNKRVFSSFFGQKNG